MGLIKLPCRGGPELPRQHRDNLEKCEMPLKSKIIWMGRTGEQGGFNASPSSVND